TTWMDAALVPLLLFLAARRVITTHDRARRLGGALALAGTILAVIGIAEKIAHFELASLSGGSALYDQALNVVRISGPYPGTEMFIVALLVCLSATIYWFQVKGPSALLIAGTAGILQGAALALTLYRSAWIGIVIVVFIAFGLRPRQFSRGLVVAGIVGLLVFASFLILDRSHTFSTRLSGQVAKANVTGRLITYTQGYQIWLKS